MRILLVAATEFEIAGFRVFTEEAGADNIWFLITGPGMVQTTFALTSLLSVSQQGKQPFDLAINAGIAGAFDPGFEKGTVVDIIRDSFADLGAENGDEFIPAATIGLINPDELPFSKGLVYASHTLKPNFLPYPKATGITVNTVSGKLETIRRRQLIFEPDTESMEGAAFFYCCRRLDLPCLQLRSISNLVEKRNRENWNLPLAVTNLNTELIKLFKLLNTKDHE